MACSVSLVGEGGSAGTGAAVSSEGGSGTELGAADVSVGCCASPVSADRPASTGAAVSTGVDSTDGCGAAGASVGCCTSLVAAEGVVSAGVAVSAEGAVPISAEGDSAAGLGEGGALAARSGSAAVDGAAASVGETGDGGEDAGSVEVPSLPCASPAWATCRVSRALGPDVGAAGRARAATGMEPAGTAALRRSSTPRFGSTATTTVATEDCFGAVLLKPWRRVAERTLSGVATMTNPAVATATPTKHPTAMASLVANPLRRGGAAALNRRGSYQRSPTGLAVRSSRSGGSARAASRTSEPVISVND